MAEINSLSPLFAFMFKCYEQLGFRFKFEYSSETRLPSLDLFFCPQLQSGPQVSACLFLPVTSANPLLNVTWRGDAP